MKFALTLVVTVVIFSVKAVFAATVPNSSSPTATPQAQGGACPQQVSGTYGVKILGANTTVSDIVINACVAMGENINNLKGGRGGSVCALTSGYRSAAHNASVGGASQSQHVNGNAIDIVLQKGDVVQFGQLLHAGLCCKNSCLGGLGYYNGNKYHVDNRRGVAAWGPGYSQTGIPQINNPGVRQLLLTHLRNSGSISLGNSQVSIATGDVTQPPQAIASLYSQVATPGQNEDGNWATNPMQQMQPAQQQVYQQPNAQQVASQPQYYPVTQAQQPYLATAPTVNQIVTVPKDVEYPMQTTTTAVSSTDDTTATVALGEGAYIRCDPSAVPEGGEAHVSWSCGKSTSTTKVVGRGFNPHNALVASVRVSPTTTEEYAVSCFANGKKIVQKTCTIDVIDATDKTTIFTKIEEAQLPSIKKGRFCVLNFCFFSQ